MDYLGKGEMLTNSVCVQTSSSCNLVWSLSSNVVSSVCAAMTHWFSWGSQYTPYNTYLFHSLWQAITCMLFPAIPLLFFPFTPSCLPPSHHSSNHSFNFFFHYSHPFFIFYLLSLRIWLPLLTGIFFSFSLFPLYFSISSLSLVSLLLHLHLRCLNWNIL